MSDLIDRQAAIDAVNEWFRLYVINRTMSNVTSIQDILLQLPSAQPEPQTCCGYDVNKLIVFATACRQQGVENGDLKAFANNCIFAWNVMSGEIAKTIEDIMRGQSDEKNNNHYGVTYDDDVDRMP